MYWFLKNPEPFPHKMLSIFIILNDIIKINIRPKEEFVLKNNINIIRSIMFKMKVPFLYFLGIKRKPITKIDITAVRDSDSNKTAKTAKIANPEIYLGSKLLLSLQYL